MFGGRLGVQREIHLSGPSCVRSLLLLCVHACACVWLQHRGGKVMMLSGSSSSGLMMMAMMSLVLSGGGSRGER